MLPKRSQKHNCQPTLTYSDKWLLRHINQTQNLGHPGPIYGQKSAADYGRHMIDKGWPHFVRHQQRGVCEDFGEELVVVSINTYLHTQYGWVRVMTLPSPFTLPTQIKHPVDFPWTATPINCPVDGFHRKDTSHTNLQLHFMQWNVEDTIIILNKGTVPHPRCGKCVMFLPLDTLVAWYLSTKICSRGVEQNFHHLAVNYAWVASGTELWDRYQILKKVDTSKYLIRMLPFDKSDCPTGVRNLQRERRKWVRLYWLLGWKGAENSNSDRFYLMVLQSVLIFVPYSWVITPHILQVGDPA